MREIFVPEVIIALFICLTLIRPSSRRLCALGGLAFMPLLALIVALAFFPAYGFRPEALPLLLFACLSAAARLPSLASSVNKRRYDDLPPFNPAAAVPALASLALCLVTALLFAPLTENYPPAPPPETFTISGLFVRVYGDQGRGRGAPPPEPPAGGPRAPRTPHNGLFLGGTAPQEKPITGGLGGLSAPQRGYGGGAPVPSAFDQRTSGGEPPMVIVLPPAGGSVGAVDLVCRALWERGFIVITWSCRGFDSPAVDGDGKAHRLALGERLRRGGIWRRGHKALKANEAGRAMEEERRRELLSVLAALREGMPQSETLRGRAGGESLRETIFLAGWNEGGSALALLGSSREFVRTHPEIKGLVMVESPLWSAYTEAPPYTPPALPEGAFRPRRLLQAAEVWFRGLLPKTVVPKPLPALAYPALTLVSWETMTRREAQGVETQKTGAGPLAMEAAFEGAGPLDYSDYPVKYPILSFLAGGRLRGGWSPWDYIDGTASVIANFARLVLQAPASNPLSLTHSAALPLETPLPGMARVEVK